MRGDFVKLVENVVIAEGSLSSLHDYLKELLDYLQKEGTIKITEGNFLGLTEESLEKLREIIRMFKQDATFKQDDQSIRNRLTSLFREFQKQLKTSIKGRINSSKVDEDVKIALSDVVDPLVYSITKRLSNVTNIEGIKIDEVNFDKYAIFKGKKPNDYFYYSKEDPNFKDDDSIEVNGEVFQRVDAPTAEEDGEVAA
jgi:hypothetical protein